MATARETKRNDDTEEFLSVLPKSKSLNRVTFSKPKLSNKMLGSRLKAREDEEHIERVRYNVQLKFCEVFLFIGISIINLIKDNS